MNIMTAYCLYLLIGGNFLLIAGIVEYADKPVEAQCIGVFAMLLASYMFGVRHQRGHW